MPTELIAVIVGGIIGIVGASLGTVLSGVIHNVRQRKSIKAIVAGEIVAIQEKAQRYLDGQASPEELGASIPMLTSIAPQLGYLFPREAVAFRRTVTLDMELRKNPNKEKALQTIEACEIAVRTLRLRM